VKLERFQHSIPFYHFTVALIQRINAAMQIPRLLATCALFFTPMVYARDLPVHSWQPERSAMLQQLVDSSVEKTLKQFADKNLKPDEVAVTLIDLRNPGKPAQASYRGDLQIYPASVVKLFYLAATHEWLEQKKIEDTEELRRSMRDMIVDSGNEPTHFIVDLLTDTSNGAELPPSELEKWYHKRNAVNRYYVSLGYTNINVNRKPWGEGPYGREMQSVKTHKPNHRNWLTTDATARLMTEIVTGTVVNRKHCDEMLQLLERKAGDKSNTQASDFTAMALPPGVKLWSKAGWTSTSRHDCAYIELPDGRKFVLVIFTERHANQKEILPYLARNIMEGFPK
jgi:hypothetical protein